MSASFPQDLLVSLLPQWHLLLQERSASGRLTAAAQEALLLDGEPQALKDLVSQWSVGDFQAVPEIVLLSNADINGALGAYAQSTGKIYLNADWLSTATKQAINSVLTEELGHYLDSKLNQTDAQGDEGEYFSDLLQGDVLTDAKKAMRTKTDNGFVLVAGNKIAVEKASATQLVSISFTDALGSPVSQASEGMRLVCNVSVDSSIASGALLYYEVTGLNGNQVTPFNAFSTSGTASVASGGNLQFTPADWSLQPTTKLHLDLSKNNALENSLLKLSIYTDSSRSSLLASSSIKIVDQNLDPLIFGNSLFIPLDISNWELAENYSISRLGGHLASINNAPERNFLYKNLFHTKYHDFFIGLSDKDNPGSLSWSDGSTSTAFPDLYRSSSGDENYMIYWINITPGFLNNQLNDTNVNGSAYSLGEVATNLDIYLPSFVEGGEILSTSITLTAGAFARKDFVEGAQVWWKVSGITADDLASGALTGTGTITNGKLDIQHSLKVDADTGEKFEVSVYSDADRTQQIGTTISAAVLEAPVVRGNSLYNIVDGPSWTQAEANSVKLGGHLAAITNIDENKWITDVFDSLIPTDEGLWIGLSYDNSTSKWKWSDGEGFNYNSWYPGEPSRTLQNDGVAREDSVHIYLTNQDGSGYHGRRGYWNDIPFNAPIAPEGKGISETPFIRRGDSAYVIVQGPTWEEAEANAVKLGGHLVTINDAAENEWIVANYSKEYLTTPWWIGLSDKDLDGTWDWADGSNQEYFNWAIGEPNTKGDYGPNYAQIYINSNVSSTLGKWNDQGNGNGWNPDGFPTLGIAEIKLAPNNTPTGTPTLSGTYKTGQVITIDRTPLQDTDNFTGYTPDFKYSWEIANHPGMTMMMPNWAPLNTADATDGNETFTITADLTGKLIRGVVSYVDGYGTQESVASLGSSPIQPGINLDIGSTSTTVSRTTTLASTISRLILSGTSNINAIGNALNNYLTGNNGNNILDGGAGNDSLAGGRGNDTYIVDSIYDSIVENINEGIELIQSSVNWTLGANLENLTLTGSGNLSGTGNELNNTIIGNSDNNVLDGGSGIDILDGGSGNDTLIGGLGNDVMKGGSGNDTYYVNSTGDSIIDTIGIDTVSSSISWTLGSILENLTLTGTDALTGIGNNDKNSIVGNSGNNVLDGLAGTDLLTGGLGADTFRFSTRPVFGALTADHISDFKGSEGDKLQISKSAFGLASSATASLTTVSSASALSTALGSTSTFVYDNSNGNLYWNQNGNKSGFGTGGIFAVLDNKSALTSSNISLF